MTTTAIPSATIQAEPTNRHAEPTGKRSEHARAKERGDARFEHEITRARARDEEAADCDSVSDRDEEASNEAPSSEPVAADRAAEADPRGAPTRAQLPAEAVERAREALRIAALATVDGRGDDRPLPTAKTANSVALPQAAPNFGLAAPGLASPSKAPLGETVSGLKPARSVSVEPLAATIGEPAARDVELDAKAIDLPREANATLHSQASETPRFAHVGELAPRVELARADAAQPSAPPAPPPSLAEAHATEILRQVRVQLSPADGQATIQLDPPELGRIAIRLVVRRGRVDAQLRVEDRATLDVLARHVPELRATLEREGMHSGSFDLQLGFGEHQEQASEQRGHRASQHVTTEPSRELASMLATKLDPNAAVDTYA